jgi:hypothetical protein
LIDGVVIDTHFVRRGRIGRLFQTVVSNPRVLGLVWERIQAFNYIILKWKQSVPGLVILVDGRDIKDTNLTQVKLGQPISINNLVVHVMSMNDTYLSKRIKCKLKRHTSNIRFKQNNNENNYTRCFFSESSISNETKIAKQTALERIKILSSFKKHIQR